MRNRYQELIDSLVSEQYITDPAIETAFRKTRRRNFLRSEHRMLEGLDTPFPIGCNQTISQPLTVAFMVSRLDPQPGHRVLEIGYGSGWLTCIIARIICPESQTEQYSGVVYAYEIVKELANFGKKNIQKDLPQDTLTRIHLYSDDYSFSFAKHAPYDRIIASAAFDQRPKALINALSKDGILVYPTHQHDIRKIKRTGQNTFDEDVFPGYVFVPITHNV